MRESRRTFLRQAATATSLLAAHSSALAAGGERLRVGLIGCGGMGTAHLRELSSRKDVQVSFVCDVDQERLGIAADLVTSVAGNRPQTATDLRMLLDDPALDAVFIATPDHWHAPAAILALDAGKHVYVEKPLCHNVREGRLLRDAVARSGKLLQVGTQSRSTEFVREGVERLLAGEIGEVLVAKAWNSQRRSSIGKSKPTAPPAGLDFDLWTGPAPAVPYRPNLLHGVWRWWRDFGCGDAGNDGVHDIDVALWGLGVESHPSRVACLGGKHFFDDDQEFPDTQYAVCEYPAADGDRTRQLIFEQRIWSPYTQEGYENGAGFYGTEGVLLLGHTKGWKLFGPRNELRAERSGSADLAAHHSNFFGCLRGERKLLNADVAAGHRAATVVHLANLAARVGRVLEFDPANERIANDAEADRLLARKYRQDHWAVPTGLDRPPAS